MKLPRKNKILSIIPYKKNTFKITTSLGVNFRVQEEILLKVPLSEGSELSESDINSIKSDNNYFMVRDTMLFRKHAIDCLKFVRSNNFYTKNPKLYMEIYEGIDKKIKFIKDSLNNVKK